MKYAASLLALVIAVQFCTGCATIVTGGGEDQPVRFASTPRGATVYVDDNRIGQTPLSARLTRKDEHKVRIEHAGYETYEKTIGSGFNEWMIGNVLIGGLIGIGVDLLSGTNPALDTNNLHAKMIKDDTALAIAPPPVYGATRPPAAAPALAPPAARPAAYQSTPPPPATYAPPPRYTPPPAPAPVQTKPAPALAPAPAARQPAPAATRPPANTGTYTGW